MQLCTADMFNDSSYAMRFEIKRDYPLEEDYTVHHDKDCGERLSQSNLSVLWWAIWLFYGEISSMAMQTCRCLWWDQFYGDADLPMLGKIRLWEREYILRCNWVPDRIFKMFDAGDRKVCWYPQVWYNMVCCIEGVAMICRVVVLSNCVQFISESSAPLAVWIALSPCKKQQCGC